MRFVMTDLSPPPHCSMPLLSKGNARTMMGSRRIQSLTLTALLSVFTSIVYAQTCTYGQACNPSSINSVIYIDCNTYSCSPDIGVGINQALRALPVYSSEGNFHGGKIVLPPGVYNQATTVSTNSPNIQIVGAGSNSTIIHCSVAGDCFNTQITPADLGSGFMMGGFSIVGVNSSSGLPPNSNTNAVGLHAGDMIGGDFFDMQIDGFTGSNGACIWIDNEANWFENDQFRHIDLGVHGGSGEYSGCNKSIRTTAKAPGTASLEGTSFVSLFMAVSNYGLSIESTASPSYIQGKANVVANGATVFNFAYASSPNFEFLVDFSNGSGTLWDVAPGVNISYSGQIITVNQTEANNKIGTVGGITYGTLNHHLTYMYESPISFGSLESLSASGNGTTYSTSSSYGVPGAYLQRQEGSPNGYQQGVGLNLFFDPATGNWTTGADGTNNGGGGVYLVHGGNSPLTFYTIPSTGGASQTIPNSSLSNYTRAVINSNGLSVYGSLTVSGAKNFRIDHPLDPENKYLYHASVESPEMKNMYDGVVTLDGNGEAVVQLPSWFEALNKDFRYQLACIGGFAPVYVADKVHDNQFRIAGGTPNLEVSWQVTGIRHDAYAIAHPSPVEEDKPKMDQVH